MTLVAIATHPDRAEILTDSLLTNANSRRVYTTAGGFKVRQVPGLPAVAASTGNAAFGKRWAAHLAALAEDAPDFDELVHQARPAGVPNAGDRAQVYAVGWSATAGGFTAHAWAPWTDWAPVEVSGLHLQPHPYGYARGDDLLDRRLAHEVANGTADATTPIVLPDGPIQPRPQTARDWAVIVAAIRATRAVKPDDMRLRNSIGGTITRTTLTTTAVRDDLIAVLDHPDLPPAPDFAAMFTGTEHPSFQLGPCVCGSRRPLTDCHGMAVRGGKPCTCGSERLFEDCCRVTADEDPPWLLPGHLDGDDLLVPVGA